MLTTNLLKNKCNTSFITRIAWRKTDNTMDYSFVVLEVGLEFEGFTVFKATHDPIRQCLHIYKGVSSTLFTALKLSHNPAKYSTLQ